MRPPKAKETKVKNAQDCLQLQSFYTVQEAAEKKESLQNKEKAWAIIQSNNHRFIWRTYKALTW